MGEDWQPIETAPKDGTLIVVTAGGEGSYEMRWSPTGRNGLLPGVVGMWEHPSGSFTWDESKGFGPTHWQPLPPPPQSIMKGNHAPVREGC